MTDTAALYESAHRPLSDVLDAVPAGAWTSPSPCAGWTARDVVAHLVDTQREFLTGRGLDLGAAPDVDADPAAAWRDHAKRVLAVISEDAVVDAAFDGFFGPTTVGATFAQFYVWDMVVHRWDVARSVGADAGLTDAELDWIERGADGFGEALYMDGICRPAVSADPGADRVTRVLARLGRSA
jgi:uncharacterized protein (TIGR03086 family)